MFILRNRNKATIILEFSIVQKKSLQNHWEKIDDWLIVHETISEILFNWWHLS